MTQHKDATEKLLDHNRQQLSALMDGELSPDEARFLLRRLQHDESLAQSISRWQLCGDVLRGHAHAPAPEGFARAVAAAIVREQDGSHAVGTATGWRPARWGAGLALAASVAVVALFVGRQTPDLATPESTSQSTRVAAQAQPETAAIATTTPAASTPAASTPFAPTRTAPKPGQPNAPDTAADIVAVAAVAELPRRAVTRRSRGQSQRAATRSSIQRGAEPRVAIASATPATAVAGDRDRQLTAGMSTARSATARSTTARSTTANPFTTKTDVITPRPWPRALLPGTPSTGFNVDYGRQQPAASGFHPFQLRAVPDRVHPVPAGQESDPPAPVAPAAVEQQAVELPTVDASGGDAR